MGKIVFTALGAVILLGVTFLDYTLLKKCTASVYAVFCGVLILMAVYIRSHGLNTRIFGISAASAQLAQLAPALMAGVLANKKRCRIADLLQIAVMLALPLLACGLCYQFSYSVMLVAAYFIAFTAMLAMGERWAKRLYIAPAAFTVMMSSLIITHPYRLERFTAFLTRGQSDPHGAGYISAVLNGVVKNALPIGGGEVPEIISCERVTYMISWILGKFGYLAAGGVIAVLAVLIARMFMASAKIKNRYGRILGLMCSSVMCVKFAWNVLMNLGLLPVMGITLPIIGVGGTDYVLSMALIGLILSACRRNNMVYETNEVPKSSNAARFWHGVVDKVFGE